MDLDNINDIEVLREAAKECRVKIKANVQDDLEVYTFEKGYWYVVEQDQYYVTIYSNDYQYTRTFTYEEASQYLECA